MKSVAQVVMLAALLAPLPGCAGGVGGEGFGLGNYTLVRAKERAVGNGNLRVTPPREWNKQRPQIFVDIREVEDWTQNGPLLDGISFVTGLKSGDTLVRQTRRDDRQVGEGSQSTGLGRRRRQDLRRRDAFVPR